MREQHFGALIAVNAFPPSKGVLFMRCRFLTGLAVSSNHPGVSDRTKSNKNGSRSEIEQDRASNFVWVRFSNRSNKSNKIRRTQSNKIAHNLTESGSILFGLHLLTPETNISTTRRSNHNQPLLTGIKKKTSQKVSRLCIFCRRNERTKPENKTTVQFMHYQRWLTPTNKRSIMVRNSMTLIDRRPFDKRRFDCVQFKKFLCEFKLVGFPNSIEDYHCSILFDLTNVRSDTPGVI